MDKKTYKVDAIKNGTVIDHIPEEKGLQIVDILGLPEWPYPVVLGISFTSKRNKKKDIIKVEKKELNEEEVHKVSLIAPKATICIIRNYQVAKKLKVEMPEIIEGIIKCNNPDCITNHEEVKTKFIRESNKKSNYRCTYCERYFAEKDVILN